MQRLFSHHNHFTGDWPWANFTPAEVACNHCGELFLDPASMDALQLLCDILGKPVIVTSGHRCAAHNADVGGTENSQHLKIAFDCACPAKEQDAFCHAAVQAGFTGIGRYAARGFVHLDCGPERAWRG